jgi:hypothetical protein
MKKLLLVGSLLLSGLMAFGQGTVLFNNRVSGVLDAPVFVGDLAGAKADGATYWGQLYAGPDAGSLAAVGAPVAFRTGAGAGYISGGTVTIASVAPGANAVIELRAWDGTKGATYEAASAAGGGFYVGKSAQITIATGGSGTPPSLPANLVGLQSFAIAVPEPSTIALGLLGAAALLIRRRK